MSTVSKSTSPRQLDRADWKGCFRADRDKWLDAHRVDSLTGRLVATR